MTTTKKKMMMMITLVRHSFACGVAKEEQEKTNGGFVGFALELALKYYSSMHTSSGQREWVGVVCYRLSYVVG